MPSADQAPATGWIFAGVRILLGLLWLQNVGWKIPPGFSGFGNWVQVGIDHPVFPPFSSLLERVVQPHLALFGWGVLAVEGLLAAMLLAGLATRVWGVVGAVHGLAIGLTVANGPNEWGWSYWLLIAAHLAVVAGAAGRTAGLDGVLRTSLATRSGRWRLAYLRYAS